MIGQRLDSMILEVFSNLSDSLVLRRMGKHFLPRLVVRGKGNIFKLKKDGFRLNKEEIYYSEGGKRLAQRSCG